MNDHLWQHLTGGEPGEMSGSFYITNILPPILDDSDNRNFQ